MSHLLRNLLSRVDAMVARVENHEGVVRAALNDERARLARALSELDRARARAVGLDEAWRSAVEEQLGWHERAKSEADEAVALECLRLGKRARARAAETSEQCHQQAELQRRLETLVVRLTERVGSLEQQRLLMQSRQSDADLVRARQKVAYDPDNDVEALLGRWEASLAQATQRLDALATDGDADALEPLGDEFLRLELDELRREEK